MGLTAAYYGLRTMEDVSASIRGRVETIALTANTTRGFFNGDIVNVGVGVATPTSATPTTSRDGATPWGIFIGANWTDQNGRPQYTQYLPANAYTSFSGYGPITLEVVTDPDARFVVRADGPITVAMIGLNAQLGNFSAGSVVTGNSGVNLVSASPATTNTFGVKIIGIAPHADNTAGDLFTEAICIWNQNVHAFRNILGA